MIETNNLYYASYLFSEGLEIANVEKRYDNRLGNTVVFIFNGVDEETEDKLQEAFAEGTAYTNIRGYLESLDKIRDIMYGLMNKNQRGAKDEQTKRIARSIRAN